MPSRRPTSRIRNNRLGRVGIGSFARILPSSRYNRRSGILSRGSEYFFVRSEESCHPVESCVGLEACKLAPRPTLSVGRVVVFSPSCITLRHATPSKLGTNGRP